MIYASHALIASLGDHTACYSLRGASTHLLDAFPSAVLAYISDHEATSLEDIRLHMAREMGEPAPEDALRRVLGQLLAHGLISSVDAAA